MNQFIQAPDFLGKGAVFHHIGLAVRKIDSQFADKKIYDPIQHVYVAFVDFYGCPVELVEPEGEDSPINKILERGMSTYHLCFSVLDIDQSIKTAKDFGCSCIAQPVAAAAFGGRKIAWLRSKEYGIIELLEK